MSKLVLAVALLCAIGIAACDTNDAPAPAGSGANATASPAPAGSGTAAPAPSLTAAGLRIASTVSGLDSPTQIMFLGNDDLLVTLKKGTIVRVTGGKVGAPVLGLAANFADERGVLGIVRHPQFDSNHFVYVYWTWSGQGGDPAGLLGAATDDLEKVPALGNRVDRFVWDGSKLAFDRNIVQLPSKITDLTLDRRRGNHDAGVIKFGPDGKLYVAIGDQNVRGQLQNIGDGDKLEGPENLLGVVLRLNDDGTAPGDNPFAGAGPEAAKIWLYGMRNTFGFTFDRRSGGLWLQMNGQAAYDEIGRYSGGDNLGWIQLMGPPERLASYKEIEEKTDRLLDSKEFPPRFLASDTATAMAHLHMLPGAHYKAPLFAWKYVVAPTDIEFIDDSRFGDDLDGDMLIGTVLTGMILRLDVNADRTDFALSGALQDRVDDNEGPGTIKELGDANVFGRNFGVVTDIATAPDGALWVSSISNGALYRIAPN